MRVVFAGTPAVAVPSLEAIVASSHEVVAVVTRPDAAAGRGRKVVRSDVGQWADAHDVPVLSPRRPSEPEFLAALRELLPDCCPVVAYGALVPRPVLDVPKHGWVNLHFSLLPAWRGAAPVQRAVMAGDPVTGASTFLLEEGLDTGPVYGVLTETVRPRDTAGDLLDRLAQAGAGLLVATLDGIESGSLAAVPQSPDGVSLAPKISVEEARVDWALPAFVVDRRVRGCSPEPGAWTTLRGERVKLGPVSPVPQEQAPEQTTADAATPAVGPAPTVGPTPTVGAARPGTLVVGRRGVNVITGGGVVTLGLVQPQGKRPMPAADWARGLRIDAGEAFE